MGKKGGGGFNVFESYIAAGLSSQSTTSADNEPIPLPDSMRTSTLIEQIGKDHQWSEDQIDTDIITLENNRLYYVKDLRELSKSSWKAIELLPLVKDLLRNALDPNRKFKGEKLSKKDKKKLKKKDKKKYKKEKKMKLGEPVTSNDFKNEALFTEGVISEDPETIRNTLQNLTLNGGTTMTKEQKKSDKKKNKKTVSFSENDPVQETNSSSSSGSSSSSSDSDCDEKLCTTNVTVTNGKPKVFTGGRPIKVVSGNRIRVHTLDGNVYETDRFCPHKKVDLNTWGQVLGNQLVCTKHNWNFPLDGSSLATKGRNINPCKVNDW